MEHRRHNQWKDNDDSRKQKHCLEEKVTFRYSTQASPMGRAGTKTVEQTAARSPLSNLVTERRRFQRLNSRAIEWRRFQRHYGIGDTIAKSFSSFRDTGICVAGVPQRRWGSGTKAMDWWDDGYGLPGRTGCFRGI